MPFIFYDTETTGISPAFDQILQFASITTDDDLNEISRFEIRSRLLPYVVPSPHALRVTGQTIDDLLDETRPSHYDMVTEIRRVLSGTCPAMFVGYNSLRFDEEILRQAFYGCLYPPYLTNTSGSRRADAMHLIRASAVLHPDAIAPAFSDNGRPSFKLDRLAPANGFAHANAHDALADVEALLHLCRIVRDRCPALWARFQQFASKAAVEAFLRREEAFLLLEFHPTSTGRYFVTPISKNSANIAYCYDLCIDPDDLRALSDTELAARLGRSPRPLRKVRKNAAPALCSLDDVPDELYGDKAPAEMIQRAQALRCDRALVDRLIAVAIGTETQYPPSPYVERQIYEGFWSDADAGRMEAFHGATWEGRVTIANEFDDPRLVWLARRLIFAEKPHLLSMEHHTVLAVETACRMTASASECGGWMTLERAASDLAEMMAGQDIGADSPLVRLQAYFEKLRSRALGDTSVPLKHSVTVSGSQIVL